MIKVLISYLVMFSALAHENSLRNKKLFVETCYLYSQKNGNARYFNRTKSDLMPPFDYLDYLYIENFHDLNKKLVIISGSRDSSNENYIDKVNLKLREIIGKHLDNYFWHNTSLLIVNNEKPYEDNPKVWKKIEKEISISSFKKIYNIKLILSHTCMIRKTFKDRLNTDKVVFEVPILLNQDKECSRNLILEVFEEILKSNQES